MAEFVKKDNIINELKCIANRRIKDLENKPHWISVNGVVEDYEYYCSECDEIFEITEDMTEEEMVGKYRFCPYCGVEMSVFVSQDEDGYLQAINNVFDIIRE